MCVWTDIFFKWTKSSFRKAASRDGLVIFWDSWLCCQTSWIVTSSGKSNFSIFGFKTVLQFEYYLVDPPQQRQSNCLAYGVPSQATIEVLNEDRLFLSHTPSQDRQVPSQVPVQDKQVLSQSKTKSSLIKTKQGLSQDQNQDPRQHQLILSRVYTLH